MYRKFKTDPYFLQKYFVLCAVVLPILSAGLALGYSPRAHESILPWLPLTLLFCSSSFLSIMVAFIASTAIYFGISHANIPWVHLPFLLLAAGYLGIWSNVLIHNASHNAIRPRWLNRVVGELCGIQLLSGFPGFAILHLEHHRHSDDLERDPHPNPPGMGFWRYVNETRLQLRRTFARMYRENWGHDPKYARSLQGVKLLIPLNRALRAIFLLVLLGPEAFTFLFIPSHVVTQLAFGFINYYSHRRQPDGSVVLVNLDYSLSLKIMNRAFAGAFYHRDHHLKPSYFNPMKARIHG